MQPNLVRAYVVELVGSFGLVYFTAAVTIMNQLVVPDGQAPGTSPLQGQQPGLIGIALAQGLIYAVLLTHTLPVAGGCLNPALAVTLWAFNRLESRRLAWLIGAQFLGAFIAGALLRLTFDFDLLKATQFGSPHLNLQAYKVLDQATRFAGAGVELVLTFFLAFAIFAVWRESPRAAGWMAGAVLAAAVLVGFSLTGAALNPARWFGPVVWDYAMGQPTLTTPAPFADALVYLAGPTLGALAGGAFCFLVYQPDGTKK